MNEESINRALDDVFRMILYSIIPNEIKGKERFNRGLELLNGTAELPRGITSL